MTVLNLDRFFPRLGESRSLPVWCVTPDTEGCIHRYYDTSPISPSGRYLALTKLPFENRLPSPGDIAQIVIVDLLEGGIRSVAETRGWDTQLGAQAQWGHDDTALFFNDVDPLTWTPFGIRFSPLTGESRRLGGTVYMMAPDGRSVASPCLRRMARTQRGYGVVVPDDCIPTNHAADPAEDDGLYLTDTETGQCRLLVSLARLAKEVGLLSDKGEADEGPIYGFHVKWNPQGDRLMFVVRRTGTIGGRHASSVVTMQSDGSDIRLAVTWRRGDGNHPNWCPDGKSILMNRKVDGKILRFVMFGHDGKGFRTVADRCAGSGHPTLHPSGKILTDAYLWDAVPIQDGKVPLRWIDPTANSETVIAYIGVTTGPGNLSALRLDPHPAWDLTFRLITFNGLVGGHRRVFVADLSNWVENQG